MGYSNSSLVVYTKISPNRTIPRNHIIDTITIHVVDGDLSVEKIGSVFAPTTRQASSNYGIDSQGRIGMYVEEKDRSWASSNRANDMRAVTIEVANDGGRETGYHVSDKALASLINLVEDICRRNKITKLIWSNKKDDRINHRNGCNMTVHRDFAAKACPGDYLYSKHEYIAAQVNQRLQGMIVAPAPAPVFKSYTVRINTESLNVRKGPSTSYEITTEVHKNEVYTIVDEKDGWGKLKSGKGWIKLSYTVKR